MNIKILISIFKKENRTEGTKSNGQWLASCTWPTMSGPINPPSLVFLDVA